MKRNIAILLIAAMTITLVACTSKDQNRTVVKKGDKAITILEGENTVGNEELKVEKVEEFKNIRALEWQDEDKLLISGENTNVDKIQGEGETFYPNNLYIFDTSTGKSKVLREEGANQLFAEFSPDKKHIFFKKNYEETAGGYIMDSQGQNEVSITGDNTMHVTAGRWLDNERVIYPDYSGIVYEADISGKIVEIVDLKINTLDKVYKIGDRIYYITPQDWKLKKYDLTSKENSLVEENVFGVIPSHDENRIAYIKMNEGRADELIVCDKNFSNKKTIAEGDTINGPEWSPDNTKIVYSTSQSTADNSGTYVVDLKTGKTTKIALYTDIFNLSWSPSGKKIAVCQITTNKDDDNNGFKTNVVTIGN